MTVQTDIAMPKRQLKVVEDLVRQSAWATAIKDSVRAIAAEDKDCRVLDLAAGAGKLHMYVYAVLCCAVLCCAVLCCAVL